MTQHNNLSALLHEHCDELVAHVKLFRDYATTPNSSWLAKSELNHIQARLSEIEQILQRSDSGQQS